MNTPTMKPTMALGLLKEYGPQMHRYEREALQAIASGAHRVVEATSEPPSTPPSRVGLPQLGIDLLRNAFRAHATFAATRYLMACTAGRLSGYEKAERHQEMAQFLAETFHDPSRPDLGDCKVLAKRIRDATRSITDSLDVSIGFPVEDRHPDYEALVTPFLDKFFAIALAEAGLESAEPHPEPASVQSPGEWVKLTLTPSGDAWLLEASRATGNRPLQPPEQSILRLPLRDTQ